MACNAHKDPNFAVICSFLDQFGELLSIPQISFNELQDFLNNCKEVPTSLFELIWSLLKRLMKSATNKQKWEKQLTKFCYTYSGVDGWELEQCGFIGCKMQTKLRIIKNLMEGQFDKNAKFKEKTNSKTPDELRHLPVGRDRNGLEYWYIIDDDMNLYMYREDKDDIDAETWELIVQNRDDLLSLIEKLAIIEEVKSDEDSQPASPSIDMKKEINEIKEEIKEDVLPTKCDDENDKHSDVKNEELSNETEKVKEENVKEDTEQTDSEIKKECDNKCADDKLKSDTNECEKEQYTEEDGAEKTFTQCTNEKETVDLVNSEKIEANEETIKSHKDEKSDIVNGEVVDVDKEHVQQIEDDDISTGNDNDESISVKNTADNCKSNSVESDAKVTETVIKFKKLNNLKKNKTCSDSDDVALVEVRRSSRTTKGIKPEFLQIQESPRTKKKKIEEEIIASKETETPKKKKKDRKKAKNKKKKKKKRGRKKKYGSTSEDGSDSDDSFFGNYGQEEEYDEELVPYHPPSDVDVEEDDSEYEPQGRNAKRAAAIKRKQEMATVPEEVNTDTPCTKCGKFNQPEWILLCDKCEAGFHTACLRPPLMIIPDGDWFCPSCENNTLIETLQEKLKDYDRLYKEKEKKIMRKKRLAYVTISLDNVIKEKGKHRKQDSDKENIEDYDSYSDEDSETEDESSSSSEEELNFLQQRSCRTRKPINYKFTEYDELIKSAVKSEEEVVAEECPLTYEDQEVKEVNFGRGKDMSTITGERPSPVMKKARKKKQRRLCSLDDSEDEADEESEEEYQATDDDDVSVAEEVEETSSSGSDDSIIRRQRRKYGSRKSSRLSRGKKKRRSYYDDDFVVDDDDSGGRKRNTRSTRKSTRRVKYTEVSEEENDDDWSDNSQANNYKKHKRVINDTDESEDSDYNRKRIDNKSKRKAKNCVSEDSDYALPSKKTRKAAAKVNFKDILNSDSEEGETVKKRKGKIESESEYEEEGEEENGEEEEEEEEEAEEGSSSNIDNTAAVNIPPKQNKPEASAERTESRPKSVTTSNNDMAHRPNSVSPGSGFMIDNLLKGTKSSTDIVDDDDLSDISDIVTFVTGDTI